ncbi:AI-2E family transporter [Roseomonas sp. NAR14]|uniref:AI-2E family transporter n=1 Tax=Roseomonas acroporae TaxID=2937791 RepID=A0A9X2BWS5_9PROT|nr:AI-2E family transporter [Roseomonas acroporae]MCK8785249.1 AI-2E family transporter [Roseomonas acroporae]
MDSLLRPARLLGFLATVALAVGCLLVLRPFLSALLWAAILVYSTWPLFRLLRQRTGLGPTWAALLMVTLETLLVALPLAFAAPVRREDVEGLRASIESLLSDGLPGLGDWLAGLPVVGGYINEWLHSLRFDFSGLLGMVRPYLGVIAQQLLGLLLAVLSGLAELLVSLFLAFFLYRDGPAIAARTEAVIGKMAGARTKRLITLTGDVTQGVVYGLIGTAIAQGIMTAFGLWIAGVPQPVLLGVVTGCISIFPIGAPVVWIPASLWLFSQGSTGWGIFLALYGALGISSVDNVIRPLMISRGADLPLLLTLLGALGGVFAFGFLGLFLGPVLLAVGFTLLKEWAEDPVVEVAPHAPDV